jgi:hypothetical protein
MQSARLQAMRLGEPDIGPNPESRSALAARLGTAAHEATGPRRPGMPLIWINIAQR